MGKKRNPSSGGKPRQTRDDDDDLGDLATAVSQTIAPQTQSAEESSRQATAILSWQSVALSLPMLLLREEFKLSAEPRDLALIVVIVALAGLMRYIVYTRSFKARVRKGSVPEKAAWRTLLVCGVTELSLCLISLLYLFKFLFKGFSDTLSDNALVGPKTEAKLHYIFCALFPSLCLLLTRVFDLL